MPILRALDALILSLLTVVEVEVEVDRTQR